MKRIAVFASGSGSNAENIFLFFQKNEDIEVNCILSNNPKAFVFERAKQLGIPAFNFNRDSFYKSGEIIQLLKDRNIDFIVLAGFLWLVPENLIKAFPDKIINIHPALLPKYGGKGMYGSHVHQAVFENKEKETGITIHLVNEKYDDGAIVFQAKCALDESDTPDSIARKIHELEYQFFPGIVQQVVLS